MSHAASVLPLSIEQELDLAAGAFRGTVLSSRSYKNTADGHIYTATLFRVVEPLRGKFASTVRLVERGGEADGEMEFDSLSPRFSPGDEHLLVAGRRSDGTLFAFRGAASAALLARPASKANRSTRAQMIRPNQVLLQRARAHVSSRPGGAADFTDQSAASVAPGTPSITTGADGAFAVPGLTGTVPARFLQPDRDEPIPYIIDAQSLPAGITQAQAITAVQNALAAWASVSSLKFVFEGLADFGMAASSVTATDGKIRIQLHDNYFFINSANVLGRGGYTPNAGGYAAGGTGARVGANEFHKITRGYLVIEHGHPAMQNLKTFEEVLCHEIGHVLGLAHSSENAAESNTTLREATMFFQVHADGRGATLGSYDPPAIQLVHPSDTPPFAADRMLDAITSPVTPNLAGVNEIEARRYDRQSPSADLTFSVVSQTSNNGSFTVDDTIVKFTPAADYGQSSRLDPAGPSSFDRLVGRISDGVNASPFFSVRVISFNPDSSPASTDGIPDQWMTTYFSDVDPAAGANRGANDDYDGDGKTNLEEFRSGTSPIDATSTLRIGAYDGATLQWTARPYEVYEVQSSADFTSWTRLLAPITPTGAAATVSSTAVLPADASPKKFYRVERVP